VKELVAPLLRLLIVGAAFLFSDRVGISTIDSGEKITERGNPDPASFYFSYTIQNIEGRVRISGRRSAGNYYSLDADLKESGK
jgi:hypothetical protein